MFLSANEIAQSREHALSNWFDLSAACIEAARRLTGLVSEAGRVAIEQGGRQFSNFDQDRIDPISGLDTAAWLGQVAGVNRLLDNTLAILGEAHKAMIRSAEAQVRVFDEIAFASIRRATKTSPWEAELALNAMKATLQNVEQTLHGMSAAAVASIELAEQDAHQAIECLEEARPAPRKRRAVSP